MSPFDLHPVIGLCMAMLCAFLAIICGALATTFWSSKPEDPAGARAWCRFFALFAGGCTIAFSACAGAYLLAGLYAPVAAVYGWLVL